MTKPSEELKRVMKEAQELDSKTALRVLIIVDDSIQEFRDQILEFQQQARETNVNVQKAFIDTGATVQTLRSELAAYRLERNASELEEKAKAFEIAKRRANSTMTTSERIEVEKVVSTALNADKIDIRGIKVPTKFLPWIIIGSFLLTAMILLLFPDVVAQILLRLAGMIDGAP